MKPLIAALFLATAALAAAGCGGSTTSSSTTTAPPRGGQVWEIESDGRRAGTPADVLAFVNGLHVLVIDGDRVYGGMTQLPATRAADGSLTLALANGVTARLAQAGDAYQLTFSTGESTRLRQRQRPNSTE